MNHQFTTNLCCAVVMALSTVWTSSATGADDESRQDYSQRKQMEAAAQPSTSPSSEEKISTKKDLILSAISEPEDNMIRQFFLETNLKNEIVRLTIKPEKGDILTYDLDTLLKEEVLVSSYAGINAVLMKTQLVTPKEALLKIRYLKHIPSTYEIFDLRVRLNEKNIWTVYQSDSIQSVSWVYFHSKTLLGTAIGIERFDFHTEKPTLAH